MSNTDLELGPSPGFPRRLKVSWRPGGMVVVTLSSPNDVMLQLTSFERDSRQYLSLNDGPTGCVLWLNRTAFELSPKEFARLRDTFGPLGLPVKTTSPPTTDPSLPVVHEAAPVTRSRDVERGMPSSPVCTGGDALECDETTVVAALLTAHEIH